MNIKQTNLACELMFEEDIKNKTKENSSDKS